MPSPKKSGWYCFLVQKSCCHQLRFLVLSHQIYNTFFFEHPRCSAGFQDISNGTRPTNGPTGPPKKNLSIYYSSINLLNRVRWVQVPFNFWWMDFFKINNIRTPTTKHTPHTLPRVLDSLPLKFRVKKSVAVGWEWWLMGRSWLREKHKRDN